MKVSAPSIMESCVLYWQRNVQQYPGFSTQGGPNGGRTELSNRDLFGGGNYTDDFATKQQFVELLGQVNV